MRILKQIEVLTKLKNLRFPFFRILRTKIEIWEIVFLKPFFFEIYKSRANKESAETSIKKHFPKSESYFTSSFTNSIEWQEHFEISQLNQEYNM